MPCVQAKINRILSFLHDVPSQPLLPIDSELVQSFQNDDEPDIEAFIDRMIDIRDKTKEVA